MDGVTRIHSPSNNDTGVNSKTRIEGQRMGKARELVRESEWLQIYRLNPNLWIQTSKFLAGGLELKADDFDHKWESLSARDRLDLCSAYIAKPQLSDEDEKILDIIMREGDEISWSHIVSVLVRHSDRKRVLAFIRERIQNQSPPLANFYQAAETLGDQGVVPQLQEKYRHYLEGGLTPKRGDRVLSIDYLVCARALWKLTGLQQYEELLKTYLQAADKFVRDSAKRLLST